MKKLTRIIIVECHQVESEVISEFLLCDNNLDVVRVWSCTRIQMEQKVVLQQIIKRENLNVYFEWFA